MTNNRKPFTFINIKANIIQERSVLVYHIERKHSLRDTIGLFHLATSSSQLTYSSSYLISRNKKKPAPRPYAD